MENKLNYSKLLSAVIVSAGIVLLGIFIKLGIDNFANKDRKVTVKGLAEREVDADRVTWPIVSKQTGNDLLKLYKENEHTQAVIRQFLLSHGIKQSEIGTKAPEVIDRQADRYSQEKGNRYYVTSVITVTSNDVKKVRSILARQSELFKQGVAIVSGEYENPIRYEYTSFSSLKSKMMEEAITNAEKTAEQFAQNSHSTLDKIISADQGQFSIEDKDPNTPHIKKLRVVTTITYSLKN